MEIDYASDLCEPNKDSRVTTSGIIGFFSSYKNGNIGIRYRSTIERDFMYFLEFDPDVVKYFSQYRKIKNNAYKGKLHSYTPDFWVVKKSQNLIVECKPERKLNNERVIQQITIGKAWALANNFSFEVVTDVQLRSGYRLKNLTLLYKYCRFPVDYSLIIRCKEVLQINKDGLPLGDLTAELSGKHKDFSCLPAIYSLVFSHFLAVDLTNPFGKESVITLS